MTDTITAAPFVSRYDRMVSRVHDVLKENSKLSDKQCTELAVQVLHSLETIAETVRA